MALVELLWWIGNMIGKGLRSCRMSFEKREELVDVLRCTCCCNDVC